MLQEPVWCPKCHLRVAPFDRKTVYRKMEYHQLCFQKLVRAEAEQEKAEVKAEPLRQEKVSVAVMR